MLIGVPKEIKDNEYRVALTPSGVLALKEAGHDVVVERLAPGSGAAFLTLDFKSRRRALARSRPKRSILHSRDDRTKVKEPLSSEYEFLTGPPDLVFTFFHLAAEARPL